MDLCLRTDITKTRRWQRGGIALPKVKIAAFLDATRPLAGVGASLLFCKYVIHGSREMRLARRGGDGDGVSAGPAGAAGVVRECRSRFLVGLQELIARDAGLGTNRSQRRALDPPMV